ncbi:MAG: DNA-3-methyladenine glycosylase [Acidimicrobiales bacterium]
MLDQRALDVAPLLLGAVLRVGERAGRIVEVEAYEGSDDAASHAARGPTPRSGVMFGPPGFLYVYRIYGMHWCANIVCGPEGEPGAVLIRALEPLDGVDLMWAGRPKARKITDLCSGPGKLCAAMGIDGDHDGVDLLSPDSPVTLEISAEPGSLAVLFGPRVGITKATERPWRFAVSGNPHVSGPRLTSTLK